MEHLEVAVLEEKAIGAIDNDEEQNSDAAHKRTFRKVPLAFRAIVPILVVAVFTWMTNQWPDVPGAAKTNKVIPNTMLLDDTDR
mmetsp:Transcript_89554/g.258366  ORF Transcript_89554/g.258366 Transcript_89554/m.258366 type:complete len:84 (-) Transcript_89554:70-321(-)